MDIHGKCLYKRFILKKHKHILHTLKKFRDWKSFNGFGPRKLKLSLSELF